MSRDWRRKRGLLVEFSSFVSSLSFGERMLTYNMHTHSFGSVNSETRRKGFVASVCIRESARAVVDIRRILE